MSDDDIQFDEEYGNSNFHIRSRKILGEPTTPSMITFLLKKKIAKNEKQATIILLLIIVLFLGLSSFIIYRTIHKSKELVIVNKYGQEIPFDTYVEMLNRGVEPIL